ncbi:MAG TPA: acyltransferase domain-containing protein, partial [Acidimicrobiales bacterium]
MSPTVDAAADDPVVWRLAGADAADLLAQLDNVAPGGPPPDPRPASAGSDSRGPARLAIVEPDERKLRLARRLLAKGEPWRGRSDIWFVPTGLAARGGKVAFVFPGVEPAFAAGDIDVPALGRRVGLEAPEIRTGGVAHQTAAIYRLGIFLDRVLRRLGVEPDVVAGHSVGEWSGTVAAGLLPAEHADELIRTVELDAVELPDVDFAALAAGADVVWPIVGDIAGVELSHDNSPSQSIVCGPPDAIAAALARLREANVLGYTLPFQSGFHTPAIAPMLESIRDLAGGLPFGPGRVPMWSATTVGPYPGEQGAIVDLHLLHLVEPVRFRPLVERLYDQVGVRVFVQVGIGSLTGFIGDTLADREHAAVPLLTAKRSALAQVHRALVALWAEGVAPAETLRLPGPTPAHPPADPTAPPTPAHPPDQPPAPRRPAPARPAAAPPRAEPPGTAQPVEAPCPADPPAPEAPAAAQAPTTQPAATQPAPPAAGQRTPGQPARPAAAPSPADPPAPEAPAAAQRAAGPSTRPPAGQPAAGEPTPGQPAAAPLAQPDAQPAAAAARPAAAEAGGQGERVSA